MEEDVIVRAIDVGFGNTKHTLFRPKRGEITCDFFPSIAPPMQSSGKIDLAGQLYQRHNVVNVRVGNVTYVVGKDAYLSQDASFGRTLDQSYAMSDAYMALVRGAIAYMNVPRIDVLVVGLPVNTHHELSEALADRLTGFHPIPGPEGSEVEIEVGHVMVLPQPVGGFFDYSTRNKVYATLSKQVNLLIDPGYYTLDWVVAHGIKMVNTRSDAHEGGMSSILASIADKISQEIKTPIKDCTRIDDAIRTGTNPRFNGKEFDLSEVIHVGEEKARQFISVLANKVGSAVDIDNIILVGGGAAFLQDEIQARFPNHTITIADDPVFANVRGFQLAGEQYAASEKFLAKWRSIHAA
ncbi:MAG: hypothetical protein C0607_09940 [Azoarcus sp.]|nr:MAG: hypothetical protein C0607_09940 [Azoarcus sp.]